MLTLLTTLLLAACGRADHKDVPQPAAFDPGATAYFCGMTLGEHPGPKGQIWVGDAAQPFWFASVRDAFAYTQLPEGSKDIRAFYVTDMVNAPSWKLAARNAWIDVRQAAFVIGSTIEGGMGSSEVVPFSDKAAADAFVGHFGGRVVNFAEMARQDMLTPTSSATISGR